MHAIRALATEDLRDKRQRKGQALLLRIHNCEHILQIYRRGITRGNHALLERLKVTRFQRCHFLIHHAVVVEEMNRTQNRAVADFFSELGNFLIKFLLAYLAQHFAAKRLRNALHLRRNSCVFAGQVGMVSARIDDAQRIAVTVKVKIDLLNLRRGKVFKVHRRKAAHTRRHLVE